jgi:4-alpha-glucanotransferase
MKLQFAIHYHTKPGQQIGICGSTTELGKWDTQKGAIMRYSHDGKWIYEFELKKTLGKLEYKYFMLDDQNNILWEEGEPRSIKLPEKNISTLFIDDQWKTYSKADKLLKTSAFQDVIMKYPMAVKYSKEDSTNTISFSIKVPRLKEGYQICILGNQEILGNWNQDYPLSLNHKEGTQKWEGSISLKNIEFPVKYKYAIYHTKSNKLYMLEGGEDRIIHAPNVDNTKIAYLKNDHSFKYPYGDWKGAGVAVPVFSLRSKNGFGVGEFSDLIPFIDWAKSAGMKMVQILPINETIASHNWLDSYPYKAISVMALHPMYLNLEKMGKLNDKEANRYFAQKQNDLNTETHVNYPEVLKLKSHYYKLLFDQEKNSFFCLFT